MGKSLLEILREVAVDPAEQAALEELGAAPYLARHGFHDVNIEDVREAVGLVADTLPPEVAQALTFAGSDLVEAAGRPGEMDIAALGDVTEQLDRITPHGTGGHDATVVPGDAADAALRVTGAGGGPETSLTFGAGADIGAGPLGQDDVVGPDADPGTSGVHGGPEGNAMAPPGSLGVPEEMDTGSGVEAPDPLTNDIDEIGSGEMPDHATVLDDIGSF